MRRGLAWSLPCALLLGGCGRFGYDALPAEGADGGVGPTPDGNSLIAADAMPPTADAAPLGPFGPPFLIAELSDPLAADDDPSLTGDLQEIYFKSDRGSPGNFDIWRATRSSPSEPWSGAAAVVELSSAGFDATPEVSFDGLTLFLSSSRPGGEGGADIWLSTRDSRLEAWRDPVQVPELSSNRDEYAVVADTALTHAVLTRSVPGSGLDLLGATRSSTAEPWNEPAPLALLATPVYEADAHLDGAGRSLYFAGELAGGAGRDVHRAERPSPDAEFGPPERIVELSSAAADEDPWVSPDGRVIVFSSDRSGDQELYWAER